MRLIGWGKAGIAVAVVMVALCSHAHAFAVPPRSLVIQGSALHALHAKLSKHAPVNARAVRDSSVRLERAAVKMPPVKSANAVLGVGYVLERAKLLVGSAVLLGAARSAMRHAANWFSTRRTGAPAAAAKPVAKFATMRSARQVVAGSLETISKLFASGKSMLRKATVKAPSVKPQLKPLVSWKQWFSRVTERMTGLLPKLQRTPTLRQVVLACPGGEQAIRRVTVGALSVVAPENLKRELRHFDTENVTASSTDQQVSKLKQLAATHKLSDETVATSITKATNAVAHRIADQILQSRSGNQTFAPLLGVLDLGQTLLSKTVDLTKVSVEPNRPGSIAKATELFKRFLQWANAELMPLNDRESRIIQLQALLGLNTEQTKHIVEQEVLQWIGNTIQNPLQAAGAPPAENMSHYVEQMKALLDGDMDPQAIQQAKQMLDKLGLPVDKMFSMVEQNKDSLDPKSRELYELMRSTFDDANMEDDSQ